MVACLCALALVVAYVAQLGHYVLVAHERCADHGELVHAGEVHEDAGAHETVELARSQTTVEAADDEHGEHDHCSVLAAQQSATVPDARVALRALADLALRPGPPHARVATTGDRLALAPKTSPPPARIRC